MYVLLLLLHRPRPRRPPGLPTLGSQLGGRPDGPQQTQAAANGPHGGSVARKAAIGRPTLRSPGSWVGFGGCLLAWLVARLRRAVICDRIVCLVVDGLGLLAAVDDAVKFPEMTQSAASVRLVSGAPTQDRPAQPLFWGLLLSN
jgi:hypothetical protein